MGAGGARAPGGVSEGAENLGEKGNLLQNFNFKSSKIIWFPAIFLYFSRNKISNIPPLYGVITAISFKLVNIALWSLVLGEGAENLMSAPL